MKKVRIVFSSINIVLILLFFFLTSYYKVNSLATSIGAYAIINILLIGYFNYLRSVKCDICGGKNSIRSAKNNKIICSKCNAEIEVDKIEIGMDNAIP